MTDIELAPRVWQVWTSHTSTEAQNIEKVIARRHREQYQYTRCPYPSCTEHPTPLSTNNRYRPAQPKEQRP